MPAGSSRDGGRAARVEPPELPHTWRPFGVRVAIWVLGGLLVVLLVAVWIGLGDDVRSQFTLFQRATLVLMGVLLFLTYNSLVRSKVIATAEGLTVVNGYRRRTFEWSQVIAVHLRRGAPWGSLDLSDGTSISLIGVQGSDGDRARRAVREIRATIAARTPSV
ncbi:MAG: hypothetical protein JWR42_458 [Marmoricola sp.]|nr:hypothetical protein [Marmoricola sp.]